MSIVGKAIRYLVDSDYRFSVNADMGLYKNIPDEEFIRRKFKARLGYELDIQNPKTFNEKLQWLKLYDRKSIYTTMVDKYAAKEYVASIIGEEYIIPTLGVWDSFDEIDFNKLPDQFVLKCTHDSGGLVICKDKYKLDIKRARKKINKSLKTNYYFLGREWPYKDVKPRIIAEKYMADESGTELKDYKFFCFGGVVKCFKVDFNRFVEHHANYYDTNGNRLDFGEVDFPPDPNRVITLPNNLDQMIQYAEKLSSGIPFLRADFYNVDESVYFGELTFYPASGFGKIEPEEWDRILGQWIELPVNPNSGGG